MDVNVIWVPHALEAVGTVLDALSQLGVTPVIRAEPLATFARDRARLARAVVVWQGAERHFRGAPPPGGAARRGGGRKGGLGPRPRRHLAGGGGRPCPPRVTPPRLRPSLP